MPPRTDRLPLLLEVSIDPEPALALLDWRARRYLNPQDFLHPQATVLLALVASTRYPVGAASIVPLPSRTASLAFLIARRFRRRGLGQQLAQLTTDHAHAHGYRTVLADVHHSNTASLRALTACHYQPYGRTGPYQRLSHTHSPTPTDPRAAQPATARPSQA